MAWSGGTFTRANGATEWQDDAALGIGIEAGLHDAQDNDLATGINTCLTKDGQNTPTANLPMGGFKHTGATTATANGQYITYDQVSDASPIKIDFTNDRLGLNTSTPAFTLDVNSTNNLGEAIARFDNTAGGAGLFFRKSRGAAIGTNTIVSASDTIGTINFQGANGTGFDTAAQIYAFVDGTPGAVTDMPGGLIFTTTPDASATPVERMRITAAGNVGIGRSNPGTFGNLEVGGTAYSAISVNSSSGSGSVLILAANGTTETRINTNTNHPMVFYTNNTSRMTLTAAGSLVMNTASAVIAGDFSNATIDNRNAFMSATNNGDTYIDIIPNGTGTISSVSCYNNNIRANASYTAITTSSTDSLLVAGRNGVGTYLPLSIYVAGSQSAAFNTDGTVQLNSNIGVTASAANVFVDIADNYKLKRSTSSLRYKDNIATYTKGLAEVLLLRAVTFTDKNDHTKPAAGFIAEEVDAAGFTEFVVYDTDGLPDSLNYANMTSLLAKAIQELASMVTDLQTRVTALEGA